jgi:gamma-glutamyltranspeptidase / glutathione hydrolase
MHRRGPDQFAVRRLLLASAAALAQPNPIYSERDLIQPVYGEHGMVATQEATATRVGLTVLQNGGNAVDAGVTVAFALAVTLPRAGNIGSGGFMLVHGADTGKTVAIDYREKAGGHAFRDMFLDDAGEADPERSRYSGLAVGVPGTVAGMALALERYGTISLAEALAPAIELAEQGITVSADPSDSLKAVQERLQKWPSSTAGFYKDGGAPLVMMRGPPGLPVTRNGSSSASTMVGDIDDSGRLPGATALASPPIRP